MVTIENELEPPSATPLATHTTKRHSHHRRYTACRRANHADHRLGPPPRHPRPETANRPHHSAPTTVEGGKASSISPSPTSVTEFGFKPPCERFPYSCALKQEAKCKLRSYSRPRADTNVRPPEQKQREQEAEVVADDVANGDGEERRCMVDREDNESRVEEVAEKTTDNGDEVSNSIAVVGVDGAGNEGNPEADQLWSKLVAKDREVYEVRAKLMLKDMEVDELKAELTAKDANIGTLTAELVAKDAEFAALRAENAELTKTASGAAEADRKTTAAEGEGTRARADGQRGA
ncbi:hypothetical protein TRIUR3_07582 [Triticum urartu]|uniref:Uncharacterized protein n=1 Tax=Triticum urartu TaxID=4572 RepID=M7YF41_TRIUA|nr:hypothetical protein TRIUR3_07582 [Triticum urartu]